MALCAEIAAFVSVNWIADLSSIDGASQKPAGPLRGASCAKARPASPVKDSGWRRGNNVHLQPDGSLTEGRGPPSPVRNSAWRGGQAGSGIPMGNHASDYSTSAFQQPVPSTNQLHGASPHTRMI